MKYEEEAYLSDCEAEYVSGDLEFLDSGHGSADDVHLSDVEGEMVDTRDIGVGTDSKLLRRSRSKSPMWRAAKRPPWK